MTFERGAAFDDSTQPNPAVRAPKPASSDRSFLLVLIVGILIGMVLAAILGIGLYAFGWLDFGGIAPPPQTLCAPTAAFLPACPTCAALCVATSTPSATPSPSSSPAPAAGTPDFGATATQACSNWRSSFPGTPCPAFVTPTP